MRLLVLASAATTRDHPVTPRPEWNIAGQRAYARAGFKEFGRQRSCRWMGGRWWDDVHMDAIAAEFVSPVLGAALQPSTPR